MIDEERERKTTRKVNKDKTNERGSTTLAFLKQILDPKSKRNFDWAFATDSEKVDLDHIHHSDIQAKMENKNRIQNSGFRMKHKIKGCEDKILLFRV